MVVKVAPLHEVEVEMELLVQGTIWRLFEWKPPAVRPTFDYRALPAFPSQCVHVDCTYIDLPDGTQLVVDAKRCVKDASVGFLCEKHDWKVLSQSKQVQVVRPVRDYDEEIVEGLIRYEQREITHLMVNNMIHEEKIGKTRLVTVKGFVGKPLNPKDYAEFDREIDGLEDPLE